MFNKLLIANRGEIAVRIIRACRDLGVHSVAVYSAADVTSLHVLLADEAHYIGPAEASESYLNIAAIIDAARKSGAEAIHPGYGFLSENAEFAAAVVAAGLVWVGPPADTISLVGNKDSARAAMRAAGLPLIPGSSILSGPEEALAEAERVGYPAIFKPVAGGGGQGMFVVHNRAELVERLAMFGLVKDAFFVERYVSDARHIEVQIVADSFGHCIHLGERECSLQRRHQKILEEAPSSALTESLRQEVGALATTAAKSIDYTNVGTVEFIFDKQTRQFYFMEINPRIQVEHAITEIITGFDIVRRQIRIAAQEHFNTKQSNIEFYGHALECRINAEDPENNFMPSPGMIDYYHQPGGPFVRIDSGVAAGSTIPMYYDSLISKLIVYGRTRGDAIRHAKRALAEYKISGIKTTIGLHRQVLVNPDFCRGNTSTRFIDDFVS